MGAFGERMQREREMRGVTLDEISVVTKIGTRSLKALEQEEFDKLPGGIFNKGFVRAYARYLGIDPDEAVADYLAAVEGRNRPAFESPTVAPIPPSDPGPEFASVEEPESSYGGLVFAAIILVLAIAAGGWWILSGRGLSIDSIKKLVQKQNASDTSSTAQKQQPAQTSGDATQNRSAARPQTPAPVQGRAPVLAEVNPGMLSPAAKAADERAAKAAAEKAAMEKTAGNTPAELEPEVTTSVSTVPEGAGFTVQLRAAEETWVTVTADGKQVAKGLLGPGEERSIRAGKRVIVHLGNAAGVQVAFNGKPLPALGGQGEVKTLAFGPNGREAYTPPVRPPESPAPQPAANPPNPQ